MKTIILTCATVWAWLRWPTLRIMYLSANPRVASSSARMARDLIRSEWFRTTFAPRWGTEYLDGATGDPITAEEWEARNPVEPEAWEIRSDQDALSDLGNTSGGVRISRGLSSTITGEGCHWLCVAKGTQVATEIGDIAIEDLVEMSPQPRVWSMTRGGTLELRKITGSHRTPNRETVRVRADSGHVLRCTDDHRIWTSRGYREAATLASSDNAGCQLSVLWRPVDASPREADPVRRLQGGDADVRCVPGDVYEGRGGARQGVAAKSRRAVLLDEVSEQRAATSADAPVCGVSNTVRTARDAREPQILFGDVRGETAWAESPDADRHRVQVLLDVGTPVVEAHEVLLDALQEPGSQPQHARNGELELQRTEQPAQRRTLGEHGAADSRARRPQVHCMWRSADVEPCSERAPHRPRSDEQHAGEPDHAVSSGSHDAPQIARATVLSVDRALESGRRETVDVYDINVEGNHNFFADGILVHNCIDDPHDTRDGHDKVAKAVEDYDSAVHNRLNDPRTSIRTLIMQRCRPNDLAAKWLTLSSVLHVRLPMEYELPYEIECKCGTCVGINAYGFADWRTQHGEPLHPRFTAAFIAEEKDRLLSRYVGQHQQRPLEPGGQVFKVAWWNWFSLTDEAPKARPKGARTSPAFVLGRRRDGSLDLDGVDISVDATGGSTDEDASNLGIGIIGRKDERRFLHRDLTVGPATWLQTMDQLKNAVLVAAKVCGKQPKLTVLVEAKAFGKAAIEQLEKHLLDGDLRYPDGTAIRARVEPYEPSGKGDKETRIELMEPDVHAGLVYLEDGEHETSKFRDEIEGYPKAPKDDRCDYLAQALDHRRKHVDDWRKFFKDRREAAKAQTRGAAVS